MCWGRAGGGYGRTVRTKTAATHPESQERFAYPKNRGDLGESMLDQDTQMTQFVCLNGTEGKGTVIPGNTLLPKENLPCSGNEIPGKDPDDIIFIYRLMREESTKALNAAWPGGGDHLALHCSALNGTSSWGSSAPSHRCFHSQPCGPLPTRK